MVPTEKGLAIQGLQLSKGASRSKVTAVGINKLKTFVMNAVMRSIQRYIIVSV